ncbi:MAG: hypothetical protein JKY45_13705 [Emcibacter sp.]|nr:hypothetical protein [Emcibacter sp.]
MKYLFLTITAMGLLFSVAYATESDAGKYQKCMGLVENNAPEAVIYANDWIFGGGGRIPAGHCKALALLARGEVIDSAILLEKLAEDLVIKGDANQADVRKNAGLRVQLYAQAALAWKEAGYKDKSKFDKAYVAYSSALVAIGEEKLSSDRTIFYELFLGRGTLQILRGQYKAAVEDFTLAIEKDSRQFEVFLQRAKAYRKRRIYLKAQLDLKVATKLSGGHPGILLERGIIFREQGKKSEARLAWQNVIDLYPKSEEANMAITNVEMLERGQ